MPSISWTPFVFLRYLVFLIAGIVFQIYLPANFFLSASLVGLSPLLYLVLFVVLNKSQKYIYSFVFGLFAFLFLFGLGSALVYWHNESNQTDHLLNIKGKIEAYQGTIISEVETKAKTYKALLKIDFVKTSLGWSDASGKILVYQPKKDSSKKFQYGDVVLIKGSPMEIPSPAHPFEFDYKKYLSYKQIYHQQFLKDQYWVIQKDKGNPLIKISLLIRHEADVVFRRFIKGKNEAAMISALVLGVRGALDDQIKDAYTKAGVVHILAVSGMHVALLFQMLLLVLGPFKRIKHGNILVGIVSLSAIWLFAFVTGLSSSVLRAVVMFTFILIGELIGRQKSPYNNIAISAFCLLVFDPFLVLDVGFQLSYLAVLGIIYFYPRIYHSLQLSNPILNFLWQTIVLSLAAQIATTPLTLFYFHQFPTYFLLTNLFIVPLSTLILNLGFGLLISSWIPLMGKWIGALLKGLMWFSNQMVFIVDSLPMSVISNIQVNGFESSLLYLVLISFIALFSTRKFNYLSLSFLLILVFSASQLHHMITDQHRSTIVVYKRGNRSGLAFRNGGITTILNGDNSDRNAPIRYQFYKCFQLLVWKGKTIVIVHHPLPHNFSHSRLIAVDLVIIKEKAMKDINSLTHIFKAKYLIFESSYSKGLNYPESLKDVVIHSLKDKGALTVNF